MNTSDARDLFSDSPDDGWRPLSVQALAEDLRSTHPQITVLRFHAKGGMGAIYEGRLQDEKGSTLSVAIKVLRPDAADDADYLRRFRREQDILAGLGDHPHIVRHRLHGTTSEGYPFLVMDWVKGRSLVEFTKDRPESKLTRQELLQIADDLCSAVQHAHEHQVLHRDLKPQNIIVTEEGRAVVLDFGIARSLRPGNTFTQPGDSPGTLGYIAPEVQNGDKPDERADIYSLGIILYQLLMKELPAPFSAKPSDQSFDPRFDEVVMKAANPEKEKRYQVVNDFAEALFAIRTANEPTAENMSAAQQSIIPRADKAVIEFDDDWITINGVVFSHEPLISDLIAVLGEPCLVAMDGFEDGAFGWKFKTFVWLSKCVIASTPWDNEIKPRRASHKSRFDRIWKLAFYFERTFINEMIDNERDGPKRTIYFFDPEKPNFAGTSFGYWGCDLVKSFSGTLRMGGVEVSSEITIEELIQKKRGNRLLEMTDTNGQPQAMASVGDVRGVYFGVTSLNRSHRDWRSGRIKVAHLQFEQWREPSETLAQAVRFQSDEHIINSFDNDHEGKDGKACALDQNDEMKLRFRAVVTNDRLIVVAGSNPVTIEQWPLRSAPAINLLNFEVVDPPPPISKKIRSAYGRDYQLQAAVVEIISIDRPPMLFRIGTSDRHDLETDLRTFSNRVASCSEKWGPKGPIIRMTPAKSEMPSVSLVSTAESTATGLIACHVCQKPISDDALTCPHCGSVNTQGRRTAERVETIGYHWFAYLPATFWFLASMAALVMTWQGVRQEQGMEGSELAYLGMGCLGIFGLGRLWHILSLKCEYLKVAPAERVIHHIQGVFNTKEMNPSRQGSIPGEERVWLGRIFGYSTLILKLQNGETLTKHCMKVSQKARDAWRGWKER